jgi:hypothetical protein
MAAALSTRLTWGTGVSVGGTGVGVSVGTGVIVGVGLAAAAVWAALVAAISSALGPQADSTKESAKTIEMRGVLGFILSLLSRKFYPDSTELRPCKLVKLALVEVHWSE